MYIMKDGLMTCLLFPFFLLDLAEVVVDGEYIYRREACLSTNIFSKNFYNPKDHSVLRIGGRLKVPPTRWFGESGEASVAIF